MFRSMAAAAAGLALMACGSAAQAGVHSEALGVCLTKSTTAEDKTAFMLWIYSAIGAHPAVRPYSRMTDADLDASAKKAADLMVRLMTVDCRKETVAVIANEGVNAFATAFKGFGETAARDLMTDPKVGAAIDRIDRFIDPKAFDVLKKDFQAQFDK